MLLWLMATGATSAPPYREAFSRDRGARLASCVWSNGCLYADEWGHDSESGGFARSEHLRKIDNRAVLFSERVSQLFFGRLDFARCLLAKQDRAQFFAQV